MAATSAQEYARYEAELSRPTAVAGAPDAAVEGFGIRAVLTAVRDGVIIEWMTERRRFLACARVRDVDGRAMWLHVVCDYTRPTDAGLVTAYVLDRGEWEDPPIRRR